MGEWVVYGLIVVFPGLGMAVVLASGRPSRPDPTHRAIWDDVTRRLGGKLFVKGGNHRVRFKWHGLDAALVEGGEVSFEIAHRLLPPESSVSIEPGKPGPRDPGDLYPPDFTLLPGAGVTSADAKAARELLSPPVVQILKDLGSLRSGGTPSLPSVSLSESFRVRRDPRRDAATLTRTALLCMQLSQHARLFGERDAGVVFEELNGKVGGECQICGALLEGTVVSCSRCSTTHHRDCWEYTGRCSTYGCGETKAGGT